MPCLPWTLLPHGSHRPMSSVSVMTRTEGAGLHSLCGLEGCADHTVLERRGGVEGVAGGTHVAPQPRQC